jgi:hypothetical protein
MAATMAYAANPGIWPGGVPGALTPLRSRPQPVGSGAVIVPLLRDWPIDGDNTYDQA